MFKIVTLLCFKCQHIVLREQNWPMLFYCCANVAKFYHTTGPKSTFLCHLVHHRTLSKTLERACAHCGRKKSHHHSLCQKLFKPTVEKTETTMVASSNQVLIQTVIVVVEILQGISSVPVCLILDSGSQRFSFLPCNVEYLGHSSDQCDSV